MEKGVNRQLAAQLRQWLSHHHSVIGISEARTLGASSSDVRSMVRRGEWELRHRSVYCDAAAPRTPYQALRAAGIATGGVASHASAAWVWGLLDRPPDVPEITVVLGTRDSRGHEGITVHRSTDLQLAVVTERHAIVVTNPLRALVDLAGTATPNQLTEAVDCALSRKLVTTAGLEAEIGRLSRRGRPGVAVLRAHLRERGFTGAPEPSVLEAHTQRLIVRANLPLPVIECRAGDEGEYRLDLAWAAILFAVEVDGYAWHWSPEHTRRDEARRNALRDQGWTLRVYTWVDVVREPERVVREITAMYRRLSPPG